jgi:hypothetical protein
MSLTKPNLHNMRASSSARSASENTVLGKHWAGTNRHLGACRVALLPLKRRIGVASISTSESQSGQSSLSRPPHLVQCGTGITADRMSPWSVQLSIKPDYFNSGSACDELHRAFSPLDWASRRTASSKGTCSSALSRSAQPLCMMHWCSLRVTHPNAITPETATAHRAFSS